MRASESDRAVVCPASLVLPREPQPNARRDKAADWGHRCHHWKETGEATDAILRKFTAAGMGGGDRDAWWPVAGGGRHEVTFALQLFRLELRFHDGPRAEADPWKAAHYGQPEWLTGTIDWVDGTWVDDLKTGREVDVTTSKQLRSYALVPWLVRNRPPGYAGLVSITHWPHYPLASTPKRTWDVVEGPELRRHLEALRYSATHPNEVNPTEDGCRYCESKAVCPEWFG